MKKLLKKITLLQNSFVKRIELEKNDSLKQIEYNNDLCQLIFDENGIINKGNLEIYIFDKFNSEPSFAKAISVYGKTYQSEFSNLLQIIFNDRDEVIKLLKIQNPTRNKVLKNLKLTISNLYDAYKDYLVNLIQFYIDNNGFTYPLSCYPQTMLSEPFYEYIKGDIQLSNYTTETKTILYLKLVEKIIFARYLELNDETRKNIIKNVSKFIRNKNEETVKISKIIRDKLYRYKGVKCPDRLIYISILSEEKANKLAQFSINQYFEEGTSLNALTLAFQGRLEIITDDHEELATYYQSNPFFSSPMVIKNKNRGFVSFIFEYLKVQGYIAHDNIWDSISKHQYFKSRKKDGEVEFVTRNEMSQSLGYKNKRLLEIKTEDKKLLELKSFLEENFPKILKLTS